MERAGQLHHLEFYVNDLAQSRKFWGELLREYGWQEFQVWDEGISWKKADGVYIVLVQVNEEHRNFINNRQAQGFNHLAFFAYPHESLQTRSEKIERSGGKILKVRNDYLCFQGPDGIVAELFLA